MMTPREREELIDECVNMTAELNGVLPIEVNRKDFERLTDEWLKQEYDWLYDMCYLK